MRRPQWWGQNERGPLRPPPPPTALALGLPGLPPQLDTPSRFCSANAGQKYEIIQN